MADTPSWGYGGESASSRGYGGASAALLKKTFERPKDAMEEQDPIPTERPVYTGDEGEDFIISQMKSTAAGSNIQVIVKIVSRVFGLPSIDVCLYALGATDQTQPRSAKSRYAAKNASP